MDWPRSFIVFPHVTLDMCVVRGEITRVSFPHEVEVPDVMEVTCSWAHFVLASRAAHALTKRMSICDKFFDDWNSAHMVPDSGVSLETFSTCRDQAFFLFMVTKTVVEIASQSRISTKKDHLLITRFRLPAPRKGIRICCRAFCVAMNFFTEDRQRVLWWPCILPSDQRPYSTFGVFSKGKKG